MKPTIFDTGAVVALLDRRDQFHLWANNQSENLFPPFITCEAVISEACFLLAKVKTGEERLLAMIESDILQIDFSLSVEISKIKSLMKKYADVPMSFADACLVRMSETSENSVVFTLDSDFRIYRKNGKRKIDLIIPE